MNQINVKRLLLAGLAMFIAWIALEILVEGIGVDLLFGRHPHGAGVNPPGMAGWSAWNHVLNIAISLLDMMLMIWLYASLRPMYGVGVKTALIASAFGIVWCVSLCFNLANLGLIPFRDGLMKSIFVAIEFPIAMIVGAEIYEGNKDEVRDTT